MTKSKNINQLIEVMIKAYQNQDYKIAYNNANLITKILPKHTLSWKIIAAFLERNGEIKKSLAAIQEAIKLAPEDSEAYYSQGIVFFRLRKLKEAKESYSKAIHLKKNFDKAHNNLGVVQDKMNQLEEAVDCYKEAIKINKDYAEAYCNLATALDKLNKNEEAKKNFSKSLELKPGYKPALLGRGQIFLKNGETDNALNDFDNCNTRDSRMSALLSLYNSSRYDEIYERIKKNLILDDDNLKIASFSSFISNKFKKDTGHGFCKNPLEFIHYSNLSSHISNPKLFIDKIVNELNNIETSWEPYNKSTINGFQSENNLFENSQNKLLSLKSIILDEIDSYYMKFRNRDCSLIKKWPRKKILFGWHVDLKCQGYQKAHIHPSGWLSGVIYLKVVPTLGKNEGAIEFSLSGRDFVDKALPKVIFKPSIGDIVFFPSSLHHRTIPFTSDSNRIIISFDLAPDNKKFREVLS